MNVSRKLRLNSKYNLVRYQNLLFLCFVILSQQINAQDIIEVSARQDLYHLHNDMEILADEDGSISTLDILTQQNFVPYTKEVIDPDFKSYWLRFTVFNNINTKELVYLNTGFFDVVKVFEVPAGQDSLTLINQSGFLLPKQKNVPETFRVNLVPIDLSPNKKTTFYIQLISESESSKKLTIPSFNEGFNLMTLESVQYTFFNIRDHLFLFSGALLIMSFFNFFIAVKGRKKLYYRLAIYNLICCLVYLNSSGYTLSSGLVEGMDSIRVLRVNLSIALSLAYNFFGISFLNIKKYFPLLFKIALVLNYLIILSFPLYWGGFYNQAIGLAMTASFLLFFIVLFVAINRYRKGDFQALVFLLSSSLVVCAFLKFITGAYFQTEHYYRNELILLISAFIELIIFTYLTVNHFVNAQKEADDLNVQKRVLLLEKTKFKNELEEKSKDLITKTADEIANQQGQNEILDLLKNIQSDENKTSNGTLEKVIFKLSSSIQERPFEKEFLTHFNGVHKGFTNRLMAKHPNLTAKDIKICAYLKMNLSSLEIAKLQGVAKSSINQSRFRIRKKMNLDKEVDLVQYITTF